ncbi:MAG: UbiA family prenyltransferase [Planctomycetota bacterium]|jgi:uncharacterized membrane protein YgdD (TMEM256/DUF423 family)
MLTVRALIVKLMTAVRLLRLTMAFGAVSDVWFVILLTRAARETAPVPVVDMPLGVALLTGAVVALGLFAYGASLNDVLDVRHDTTFSPDRPIPAGRIKLGQAIVVTVGALIIAVLAGAALGTLALWMTLLVAAGILFYNAAGRFIPAVGLVTIGLIHAAQMLIPNARLGFTLPVWLVMTHSIAIAAAVHVLEDKRPRLTRLSRVALLAGWIAWSGAIVALGVVRGEIWPQATPVWHVVWPAAAVTAFLFMARWKAGAVPKSAAAEKLKRYGAMWQALYGAAWLVALDLKTQAAWIGAFAIAGFAAMTLIKEVTGQSDRPIVYR